MAYTVNFSQSTQTIAVKLSTGGTMKATFGTVQYVNTGKQGIDGTTFYPSVEGSVKCGVTVGTNIDVSSGKISVKNGTASQKGVVQLSSAVNSDSTALAGYGITDAYTKEQVDGLVSSALHYKGSKDTYDELPTEGNTVGDMWNIVAADETHGVNAGDNVAWNGTSWDVLAGTVDLSAYLLGSDLVPITNAELDTICV